MARPRSTRPRSHGWASRYRVPHDVRPRRASERPPMSPRCRSACQPAGARASFGLHVLSRPGPAPVGHLPPWFKRLLAWPCEQPACTRWGGAQASRRPAPGVDRQPHGSRCLEGHHSSGPKRVHLLDRGCQAGNDPGAPHSPDPGGARGRPASALLLARVQAPRAHQQIASAGRPQPPTVRQDRRAVRCASAQAEARRSAASFGTAPEAADRRLCRSEPPRYPRRLCPALGLGGPRGLPR